MIQGVATTQLTPVGVGWGDYVVAWLLTYNGTDCWLWQYVYERCMEAELCRKLIELLPTIGYSLAKHKCYAEAINTEATEADQHLNQANHSHDNQSQPQQPKQAIQKPRKNSKQSPSKPKRLSRLGPLEIKAPPLGPPSLPQPSPPRWAAPDRGAHWV